MAQKRRYNRPPRLVDQIASKYSLNDRIRAREVRVVGENVETGVYPIQQALSMAEEMELDLVEISPNAAPPVCKIIDFKKFLYEQKKKHKEMKAKSTKVILKEVRFGPNTDDHDYEFKLKYARKFLEEGAKVKAYVFFKGRSIIYKDQGFEMLKRFAVDLEDIAKVDQQPKLEGKRLIVFLSPLQSKKK